MMAAMSATPWPGGPAPAEARKIADDGELRAIAGAGVGFVIDPLNRWWHVTNCPRVAAMTTGQPKWHAQTPAAREAFLKQRLARYPTALPVRACPDCAGTAAASPWRLARRPGQPVRPCWPTSSTAFHDWCAAKVMTVGIPGFSCKVPILTSTLTRLPSSFHVTDCYTSDATPAVKPIAAITVLATSREVTPDPDTRPSLQELYGQAAGRLKHDRIRSYESLSTVRRTLLRDERARVDSVSQNRSFARDE